MHSVAKLDTLLSLADSLIAINPSSSVSIVRIRANSVVHVQKKKTKSKLWCKVF